MENLTVHAENKKSLFWSYIFYTFLLSTIHFPIGTFKFFFISPLGKLKLGSLYYTESYTFFLYTKERHILYIYHIYVKSYAKSITI